MEKGSKSGMNFLASMGENVWNVTAKRLQRAPIMIYYVRDRKRKREEKNLREEK